MPEFAKRSSTLLKAVISPAPSILAALSLPIAEARAQGHSSQTFTTPVAPILPLIASYFIRSVRRFIVARASIAAPRVTPADLVVCARVSEVPNIATYSARNAGLAKRLKAA